MNKVAYPVIVLLTLALFTWGFRYDVRPGDPGLILDRWTGSVYLIYRDGAAVPAIFFEPEPPPEPPAGFILE